MDIDKIVQDIIDGKIGTSCCPEVDEVFKKYKRGEVGLEELREAIIKKWSEIHG